MKETVFISRKDTAREQNEGNYETTMPVLCCVCIETWTHAKLYSVCLSVCLPVLWQGNAKAKRHTHTLALSFSHTHWNWKKCHRGRKDVSSWSFVSRLSSVSCECTAYCLVKDRHQATDTVEVQRNKPSSAHMYRGVLPKLCP